MIQLDLLCEQDESVKGILTILCNHSFHVACLAEWKDTRYFLCVISVIKSSRSPHMGLEAVMHPDSFVDFGAV